MNDKVVKFLACVAIMLSTCFGFSEPIQEVEIIDTSIAPNGLHVATVFHVTGGGAAGYAYRLVGMRARNDVFESKTGIVFQMTGSGKLSAAWKNDRLLQIQRPRDAVVYIAENTWGSAGEIEIEYTVADDL